MTYRPPEHPVVPAAPPRTPQPSVTRPYAVGDRDAVVAAVVPSGLTSDGNVVTVRPWRTSNDVVARAAQALLGLVAAGDLLVAVLDLRTRQSLAEHDIGSMARTVELSNDLSWAGTRLTVATVVVFLVWMHRLWTSDRSAHNVYTRGTGLAVGGWLVPVANLVLAPNALRDLWHGTARARQGVFDGPVDRRTPRLITAWWLAWCLLFLSAVASRLTRVAATPPTSDAELDSLMRTALDVEITACTASTAAGVLMVVVIGRIMSFTRR